MHRETPSAVVTHCRGCKTARGTGRGGGGGGESGGSGGGGEGEHAPKLLHSEPYWLTNAAVPDHAQRMRSLFASDSPYVRCGVERSRSTAARRQDHPRADRAQHVLERQAPEHLVP